MHAQSTLQIHSSGDTECSVPTWNDSLNKSLEISSLSLSLCLTITVFYIDILYISMLFRLELNGLFFQKFNFGFWVGLPFCHWKIPWIFYIFNNNNNSDSNTNSATYSQTSISIIRGTSTWAYQISTSKTADNRGPTVPSYFISIVYRKSKTNTNCNSVAIVLDTNCML